MKGFSNLTLNVDTVDERGDNGDSAASTAFVDGEDCAAKRTSVIDTIFQNGSDVGGKFLQFGQDEVETRSSCSQMERSSSPEVASPENRKFSCTRLDTSSSDESIDADESQSEISESTSSDSAEDDVPLDGRSADLCFGDRKMVDPDSVIECRPDYILYRDKRLTDSVITFSARCITIMNSIACGENGTFVFQWGVDDVIKIESHWCERVKLTIVKIHITKGAVPNEDIDGSSGIEELKFLIGDDWYEKQDAITSLDVYKPRWNIVQDAMDVAAWLESDANALLGQGGVPKSYFPIFNEHFEDVIYPKGDPDAVSISKRDVDLLQPDTFVNDTIIDFYIKYLKDKIDPGERHRFHFFNSFFFRKLADLDKNPSSALEGRAAFQRVRKWTRKINLFEKDYVFIPVNFNYHWSLIVICHPGDVAEFRDAYPEKSPKVPCILHMDSIRGSHSGLKGLLQSYLCEEWKERQKDTPEDISSRFLNLRFVSLELPQQQNSYDCGLFLLHYVELFLKKIPVTFSPFKITKSNKFLTVDWFQPSEASLKRTVIEKLISKLLDDGSHEGSTDVGSDMIKNCSSNCPKSLDESGYNVEFLSGTRSPTQALHGNLPSSQAGNGIELTLLQTLSMKSSPCASDSGLVLKQLLNPVASVGSFYQDFEQAGPFDTYENAVPQTQGEQETSMHFVYSLSTENTLEQLSTEFGGQPSWSLGSTVKLKAHDIVDSLPESSICDDLLEVKEVNDSRVGINLSLEVKVEQPGSPLTDNIKGLRDCFGPVCSEFLNPNSQNNPAQMFDDTENADPVTPCPKDLLGSSPQQSDTHENETCEVAQTFHDDSVSEPDVEHGIKRRLDTHNDSVSEPDVEHGIKRRLDTQENGNEACEGATFHDNSVSEPDVEHATKKKRVTPPEDEEEPPRSLGVELHL